MYRVSVFASVCVAALAAAWTSPLSAQDSCCRCGGGCGVRKMCRLECVEIEISDYCYGCECEDICLPGCSKSGCLHCDGCCGPSEDCDCCDHRPACCLEWFDWCPPCCAKPKCVKKLTKYEIKRKIPSYKWVVEEVCPSCCASHGGYCPCDAEGHPLPDGVLPPEEAAPLPPPLSPAAEPALGPAASRPTKRRSLTATFEP